nr:alpha/beta hydrolase [Kineosphaera limosa]
MAGVAALTLTAAGCTTGSGDPGADGTAAAPGTTAAQPAANLSRFYEQTPKWGACDDVQPETQGSQCTWLEVPIDYASPDAGTTKLRVLKVPATGTAKGSLLVNPGGPGGSAVDYANMADWIVTGQIRRSFDVVGFDPRGVGRSEPIVCLDDVKTDEMLGADPTPDDEAEYQQMIEASKQFGQACESKYPKLLPHVSTVDAARDMDVLRSVLGDEQLTYLGKSYGTFLGATYAGLFPQRVGRLVLDGAIAPDLTNDQMNLGQAVGFETATRAYVQDCISDGNCPLGGEVEAGLTKLRDMLKQLDTNPVPVTGDARVTKLTEGWATLGLARAMYDETAWGGLTDALRQLEGGDGTDLFELAKQYADRSSDGKYGGNIMQVISAVNCLDRGAQPQDFTQMQQLGQEFAQKAPTWGPFLVYGSTTCAHWPVPATGQPEKITADGAAPIVVVGTTRDPATPYEWAQQLASQLSSGTLITYDGDGHTAYMRSNSCVDSAVDKYLLEGTPPKEDLRC